MKLALVGAGSVGLELAARLRRAGHAPLVVTRRREAAERIARAGIRVFDPSTQKAWIASPEAIGGLEHAAPRLAGLPLILCTRTPGNAELAPQLAEFAPDSTVVAAQNDVTGDAILARHCERVAGLLVRHAITRTADNEVNALAGGRMVIGAHPSAAAIAARGVRDIDALAQALAEAGYDVAVSARLQEDRWLKLCINLMSTPNALVVRTDHGSEAFVEVKVRLLEEAAAVLKAAGIRAASCDGKDRSIEDEIARQRASLQAGTSARSLPIYNAEWVALRHGAPLEAANYHDRILELGARHAVPTPINTRARSAVLRAWKEGLGPESVRALDLLGSGVG